MLPKRPKQHVTDDRAVDVIRAAFHRQGWVFRELPHDYGIDAEVEIRDRNEQMTGALLRFQIKGNSSTRAISTGRIRVKLTSIRYWTISPIPVFMARVVPDDESVQVINVKDFLRERGLEDHVQTSRNRTCTIDFTHSLPLDDWIELLEETAKEHRDAVMDISNYTLYNPASQFISYHRLFRLHNGDIRAMVDWYRRDGTDEQLIYDYGHAVYLKRLIEEDPPLLERIRALVYEDGPEPPNNGYQVSWQKKRKSRTM